MRSMIFGVAAVCVAAFSSLAQTPLVDSVNAGRGTIPLYRPSTYSASEPLPLVIALHGFTNTGASFENYLDMRGLIESEEFIYCSPDGTSNFLGQQFWNDESACCDFLNSGVDDSSYLRGLIDLIRSQYAVDERSIHVVGYSNGGFMAYRLACEHADVLASIVSLAGATPQVGSVCDPSGPVSVLQVHGTSDGTISYNGGSLGIGRGYPSAAQSVETWALFNGCDPVTTPVGGPFDLAASVSGPETTSVIYDQLCEPGYEAELWTMTGADHGPPFVPSPAGDGTSNVFSAMVLDWMLTHRKPGEDCAADANGDGVVDNGDIGVFVGLFLSGDAAVDFNGDGILDNGDIQAFVDLFLAGC